MCRLWRQLVDTPPLLRDVAVSFEAINPFYGPRPMYKWRGAPNDPARLIQHILACFRWLRKHAALHMQRLTVSLGRLGSFEDDEENENPATVHAALCKLLKACKQLQVSAAVLLLVVFSAVSRMPFVFVGTCFVHGASWGECTHQHPSATTSPLPPLHFST